jgi:thymidylate kinase
MIKKIVFDGHDGVGKSTRIEEMKKLFPGIEFSDRGIFSEATMKNDFFDKDNKPEWKKVIVKDFYDTIKGNSDTLYIILDAEPEECQRRILARGGSIDCEFHNMHDLVMYRERFKVLVDLVNDLPNVMYIRTDL